MIKRRQLRHQGWKLVSIPYWEWDELAGAPTTKAIEKRKLFTPGQRPGAAMALQERQKAYIENAVACLAAI
jgi:hypothetical protein